MIKPHIFEDTALPENLKCQILSFLRIQWSEGFVGKNRLRDWITKEEHHPIHFLLVEEKNLLVSYVCVVWKYLSHAGNTYKTYGLSGVFTYPAFRKQGHGLSLVKEAKQYIEKQDGDIALITSMHKGFYEKAGFIRMENAKLLEGNQNNPTENKENIFMEFLSEKGKTGRKDFETKPIYFGLEMW